MLGLIFLVIHCPAFGANGPAVDLMTSANRKINNVTKSTDCRQSKDSCPKAITKWVADDKSWGILPSYEKLEMCRSTDALKKVHNMKDLVEGAKQVYPQISLQGITPATVCSSEDADLDRKAVLKSTYFLARLEQTTLENTKQIAAYDAYLGGRSLAQIDCHSPLFVNLQKQCQQLSSCPSFLKKAQHVDQVANIEQENKLIDESIEKIEDQIPIARANVGRYSMHGGKDPKVLSERKAELAKLEEQMQVLRMIKQGNLKKYPVLTDPEFIEARKDNITVEKALEKAYSKARKDLVSQTQNFLDKSLCTTSLEKRGCSPSALNETLAQTRSLPDVMTKKSLNLTAFSDGIRQQDCIFNNVIDRRNTSRQIYTAAGHAGVDIGLTLLPGGAALVLASRAKAAAKLGIDATKATVRASKTGEAISAAVGIAWVGQSSLEVIRSCQSKYAEIEARTPATNQCSQVSSARFSNEFNSSDCVKAILFGVMDRLPVYNMLKSYKRRSKELKESLENSRKTAEKVQIDAAARVERQKALEQVHRENPQAQIWRELSTGNSEQANRVEKIVREELETGKIISSQRVTRSGNAPDGRSGARFVKYESGLEGVWKPNVPGENSITAEIAAAKIDQHLGAGQVPLTVNKELNGVPGTVQLKVADLKPTKASNPEELQLTDYLNGNSDRTVSGNHVETPDGKVVAIDNGRAFAVKEEGKITYGYVSNPIEPKLREIENIQRRISETEANLKKLSDGTASEAFKKNYSESELRENLAKYKSEEIVKKQAAKKSIQNMIPNQDWLARLRSTTPTDWQRMLGQQLTEKQINDLVQRQQDIINSLNRSKTLLSTP